jgi:hypothetical protein
MNVRLVIPAVLVFVLGVSTVVAQESKAQTEKDPEKWSDLYYITVPIEKIYPHTLGFMVLYRKNNTELGRLYIPDEWLNKAGGKGELIYLPNDETWPYLVIYYKQGEFYRVRLFVKRNKNHSSWGVLPQGTNISDNFNIEELKLE